MNGNLAISLRRHLRPVSRPGRLVAAVGTTANIRERPRIRVAGPSLASDIVGDVLGAALTDAHRSVDDASDPAGEL